MTDEPEMRPRHIRELQWLASYFESHGRPDAAKEIMAQLYRTTGSDGERTKRPASERYSIDTLIKTSNQIK